MSPIDMLLISTIAAVFFCVSNYILFISSAFSVYLFFSALLALFQSMNSSTLAFWQAISFLCILSSYLSFSNFSLIDPYIRLKFLSNYSTCLLIEEQPIMPKTNSLRSFGRNFSSSLSNSSPSGINGLLVYRAFYSSV